MERDRVRTKFGGPMTLASQAPFGLYISIILLAALFSDGMTQGQTWTRDRSTSAALLKPGPGEISVDKAVELGKQFLKANGMVVPKDIPTVRRNEYQGVRFGALHLQYGSEARLSVDCKTGKVYDYVNSRRENDRRAGKVARSRPLLARPLDAELYLAKLAKKLGIPKGKHRVEFSANLAGDPNEIEANSAATVKAAYQEMPDGFRLRENWGRVSLTVDPSDGAVIYFHWNPERQYTLEAKATKLTSDQARTKAAQTATRYKVGRSKSGAPTTPKVERMYVYPNGEMGGYRAPRGPNFRARLAWVARYSNGEEIWIDAGDGRLLGGNWHSSPSRK